MNAFEELVAGLFWQEGYWTHIGYKVNISKEIKVALGKSSLPRPEIDILAYQTKTNELLWIECKSYMDSRGVKVKDFTHPVAPTKSRYKIFTWDAYREKVSKELIDQVIRSGLVRNQPTLKYCLVAGHIATNIDRTALHDYFRDHQKHQWYLYDEIWIKQGLENLAKIGYEDNVSVMVAKIISKVYE